MDSLKKDIKQMNQMTVPVAVVGSGGSGTPGNLTDRERTSGIEKGITGNARKLK